MTRDLRSVVSFAVGVVAFFLFVRGSVFAADPLRLSLVRDGGAHRCPDAAKIESIVRARLGRDPFSNGASIQAEILLSGEPGAFRSRLRVIDNAVVVGERSLESDEPSCTSLGEATALALALYVDPRAALVPVASPAPVRAPVAPISAPPAVAIEELRERRSSASSSHTATLEAGPLLTAGALPQPHAGVAVVGSIAIAPRFAAELFGWFLPEIRADDRRFAFGLAGAGGRACLDVLSGAHVSGGPCAGVLGGEIHAVVYEALPTEPGGRAFVAAIGDVRVQVRLVGPLVAVARAGAGAPLVRHRFFVIGESANVFVQPPVLFAGEVGLGVSIP